MRKILKKWKFRKDPAGKNSRFFNPFKYNRILAVKAFTGLHIAPRKDADTPDVVRKKELPFFYCWYKNNRTKPERTPIDKTASVNN